MLAQLGAHLLRNQTNRLQDLDVVSTTAGGAGAAGGKGRCGGPGPGASEARHPSTGRLPSSKPLKAHQNICSIPHVVARVQKRQRRTCGPSHCACSCPCAAPQRVAAACPWLVLYFRSESECTSHTVCGRHRQCPTSAAQMSRVLARQLIHLPVCTPCLSQGGAAALDKLNAAGLGGMVGSRSLAHARTWPPRMDRGRHPSRSFGGVRRPCPGQRADWTGNRVSEAHLSASRGSEALQHCHRYKLASLLFCGLSASYLRF